MKRLAIRGYSQVTIGRAILTEMGFTDIKISRRKYLGFTAEAIDPSGDTVYIKGEFTDQNMVPDDELVPRNWVSLHIVKNINVSFDSKLARNVIDPKGQAATMWKTWQGPMRIQQRQKALESIEYPIRNAP